MEEKIYLGSEAFLLMAELGKAFTPVGEERPGYRVEAEQDVMTFTASWIIEGGKRVWSDYKISPGIMLQQWREYQPKPAPKRFSGQIAQGLMLENPGRKFRFPSKGWIAWFDGETMRFRYQCDAGEIGMILADEDFEWRYSELTGEWEDVEEPKPEKKKALSFAEARVLLAGRAFKLMERKKREENGDLTLIVAIDKEDLDATDWEVF